MLVQAERHVTLGEHHIARQREIIAKLERNGHDSTKAKELLAVPGNPSVTCHWSRPALERTQTQLMAYAIRPRNNRRRIAFCAHSRVRRAAQSRQLRRFFTPPLLSAKPAFAACRRTETRCRDGMAGREERCAEYRERRDASGLSILLEQIHQRKQASGRVDIVVEPMVECASRRSDDGRHLLRVQLFKLASGTVGSAR